MYNQFPYSNFNSSPFGTMPTLSNSSGLGGLLGLSKSAATKFTFLLSVPIIAGATILEIGNLAFTWETLMGVFTAFIVGIFSIKFLLNYIKRHDFSVFAIYRVIFAAIILIKYFIF